MRAMKRNRMNYFQTFSLLVIAVAIMFAIIRFMTRNRSKGCIECIRERQARTVIDWNADDKKNANVLRDDDDGSDLSEDEQEENGKQRVAAQ